MMEIHSSISGFLRRWPGADDHPTHRSELPAAGAMYRRRQTPAALCPALKLTAALRVMHVRKRPQLAPSRPPCPRVAAFGGAR